jgi:hypothetical protein
MKIILEFVNKSIDHFKNIFLLNSFANFFCVVSLSDSLSDAHSSSYLGFGAGTRIRATLLGDFSAFLAYLAYYTLGFFSYFTIGNCF